MTDHASFATVLANRKFLTLWLNQVLLQLSMNMLNFSLLIWVFRLTGSNAAVSLFVLSVVIPALIFGVFAGVVADILDRKKIIMITDLGMALAVLAFFLVKDQLGLILLVSLIFNSFVQFFIPTEASAIPMLVKKSELLVANSLFFFTMYGAILVGYSVAGPVVNLVGQDGIFILSAANCIIAFLIIRSLPSLKASTPDIDYDYYFGGNAVFSIKRILEATFTRIGHGFTFVFSTVRIWVAIIILALVQGVIAIVATLTPGFFEKVVKVSATDSYVLMTPLGIGLLAGAIVVGRWGRRIPRRTSIGLGILCSGVFILLLALAPVFYSFIAANEFLAKVPQTFTAHIPLISILAFWSLLLGLAAVHIAIPAQTVLQENTPSDIRGRTFSILAILNAISSAIPALAAGGAADVFGIVPVMLAVGIIIVTLTIGSFSLYLVNRSYLPDQIDNLLYGS